MSSWKPAWYEREAGREQTTNEGEAAAKLARELEAEAAERARRAAERIDPVVRQAPSEGRARILDLKAPWEVARCFVVDQHSKEGFSTLWRWRGDWYSWTGTHYDEVGKERLEAGVYDYLNRVNGGKFDPGERDVNLVMHALKSRVLLPDEVEGGAWLGGDAPWGNEPIICCKNGVLRLSDRRLWRYDPRLFALNSIETEYRPEAQALRWMQLLDELWSSDLVSREALQEFFGLVLTDETKFQKGFILFGPARSGKGTIARALFRLLGPKNYCGPSLGQLSQPFGMQSLIGKKLAVIPDARLDNRANRSVITEKLLSIIGEDPQEINRKNKEYWSGILPLRVMILSNELPDFKDDTGVIATRFVILQTVNSFLGREDTELDEKLSAEMSGILNWALEGWPRLAQRGKFIAPGDGELNEELSSNASPVKAFVRERCEFGSDYSVTIEALYQAYRPWCEGNGVSRTDQLPINLFSGKVRAAFSGQIKDFRPRDGGKRKRVFVGIRLRRSALK
jgi:putative DNA primase/helicase